MKLQKMVYIANGMHIAANDEPLIIERVEVWPYGPVIQPIYEEFRRFGNQPIDRTSLYCDLFAKTNFTSEQLKTLDFTWQVCKDWDAIRLSNWTHKPESPWTIAMSENKAYIPDEMIKEYFKKFKQPA